jgi:NarL family two-component system response regulator LiaR
VVGETDTVAETVEKARALQPDIVLLDVVLKDGSSVEAIEQILQVSSKSRVLVLSGQGAENVMPTLRRGARGFVSKDTASDHLLEAIQAVLEGGIWSEPKATGKLVDEMRAREKQRKKEEDLTPREQEVLQLVGEGKRNAEIARILCISEHTVKTHVSSLMQKLEIDDRLQLTLYAARAYGGER